MDNTDRPADVTSTNKRPTCVSGGAGIPTSLTVAAFCCREMIVHPVSCVPGTTGSATAYPNTASVRVPFVTTEDAPCGATWNCDDETMSSTFNFVTNTS